VVGGANKRPVSVSVNRRIDLPNPVMHWKKCKPMIFQAEGPFRADGAAFSTGFAHRQLKSCGVVTRVIDLGDGCTYRHSVQAATTQDVRFCTGTIA
jgi:hypothetical protein